jgi:hypothetical protein
VDGDAGEPYDPAIVVAPAFALLFGLTCSPPCAATVPDREHIEREVIRVLSEHGFQVKPAADMMTRPIGASGGVAPVDEATSLDVDRIVVLDLEPKERALWVTQYVRGFQGPWSVGQVVCARDEKKALQCPEIERVVLSGLRPRTAEDIDLVSLLRRNAAKVEVCIAAEDDLSIDDRTYGRVELDLEATTNGKVRVVALAPAVVAKKQLGKCLRQAMESMNVGAFEGEPIKFRIPVDLD